MGILPKKKRKKPPPKPESLIDRLLRYTRYPRYCIYGVGLFYVLLLLTNINFPILNERSPPPMPFDWILTYPPSSPNSMTIHEGSSIVLIANISAPEAFADGMEVIVNARGAENAQFVDSVLQMTLGFAEAYWYPLTSSGFQVSPYSGVILQPNGTDPNGLVYFVPDGDPLDHRHALLMGEERSITFRTEVNYPLSIIDLSRYFCCRFFLGFLVVL